MVAGACPARWRFSVYFLVCKTQKEDESCASHLGKVFSIAVKELLKLVRKQVH